MPVIYPEVSRGLEEERQELQTLLQSDTLRKAPKLQQFLEYLGEKHFSGEQDDVKEYSIAVHALNRAASFDPQTDTIVRVTAHSLRKRLELYYATEGADHLIQIQLPAGKYILRFQRRSIEPEPATVEEGQTHLPAEQTPATPPTLVRPSGRASPTRALVISFLCLAAVIAILAIKRARFEHSPTPTYTAPPVAVGSSSLRMLFGGHAGPYLDSAGRTWAPISYCEGGNLYAHANLDIAGTDDPTIFREGREGKFRCRIPVAPGSYQLTLLFADTAGDKEAARQVVFAINNGPTQAIDVVDEAGANNTALAKVYPGLRPMSDGSIQLDFLSEGAFASAAELTRTPSDALAPLRILAGPAALVDDAGKMWEPEQFYTGGRRTYHPDNLPRREDAQLFKWERYGHFRYQLPVVANKGYTIRLYFSEGWFGARNGGPGGRGSRVFDVYCNGTTLLKNFDILKEDTSGTVVATVRHVQSTAHGMLQLDFEPVNNYPLINAVEVDPED